jgi:hypothetical protein
MLLLIAGTLFMWAENDIGESVEGVVEQKLDMYHVWIWRY